MSYMYADTYPTGGTHYGQVCGKWSPTPGYDEQAARDAMRGVVVKKRTSVKKTLVESDGRTTHKSHLGVTVDGVFYANAHAAADACGIHPSTLTKALRKGAAKCKGHSVAYAVDEPMRVRPRRL